MISGWERRRIECGRAQPKWANENTIKLIYERGNRLGYTIDHIVPLNSDFVCGLHCEDNLRPLHGKLNMSKSNKHWPGMWNEQIEMFDSAEDNYVLQLPLL